MYCGTAPIEDVMYASIGVHLRQLSKGSRFNYAAPYTLAACRADFLRMCVTKQAPSSCCNLPTSQNQERFMRPRPAGTAYPPQS